MTPTNSAYLPYMHIGVDLGHLTLSMTVKSIYIELLFMLNESLLSNATELFSFPFI